MSSQIRTLLAILSSYDLVFFYDNIVFPYFDAIFCVFLSIFFRKEWTVFTFVHVDFFVVIANICFFSYRCIFSHIFKMILHCVFYEFYCRQLGPHLSYSILSFLFFFFFFLCVCVFAWFLLFPVRPKRGSFHANTENHCFDIVTIFAIFF